jgi:hypothetical protein
MAPTPKFQGPLVLIRRDLVYPYYSLSYGVLYLHSVLLHRVRMYGVRSVWFQQHVQAIPTSPLYLVRGIVEYRAHWRHRQGGEQCRSVFDVIKPSRMGSATGDPQLAILDQLPTPPTAISLLAGWAAACDAEMWLETDGER